LPSQPSLTLNERPGPPLTRTTGFPHCRVSKWGCEAPCDEDSVKPTTSTGQDRRIEGLAACSQGISVVLSLLLSLTLSLLLFLTLSYSLSPPPFRTGGQHTSESAKCRREACYPHSHTILQAVHHACKIWSPHIQFIKRPRGSRPKPQAAPQGRRTGQLRQDRHKAYLQANLRRYIYIYIYVYIYIYIYIS
jgi:hypothetical protein